MLKEMPTAPLHQTQFLFAKLHMHKFATLIEIMVV